MILERQSTLQAGCFVDLQARRQSEDRTGAKAELAHFEDIIIDRSHRLIPPSSDGFVGRLGLIVGALIAASGWVVISLLPLPFASAPSNRSSASLSSSAHDTDLKKGDRLQIPNAIIPTLVSAGNRETSANIAAPTLSQPSAEVPRQTRGRSTEVPRHTLATRASVRELESPVKLVPTPDTKPTTIEGWTLRDVTNGTAVLEGPNGTWRVARGDTVPGLGKVESIFRWGNRLIVATSSGLVSTP
jgi:hypothetical protein